MDLGDPLCNGCSSIWCILDLEAVQEEKRMEENDLALRFQILGLKPAKGEIEEARLAFKSYVVNQGQLDSMRDDYCQRLHRAIVKQNGYVEQEELTSEEERRMKFLEKGNQKWGQEKIAERLMIRESIVRRREVDHTGMAQGHNGEEMKRGVA